MKGCIRCAIDNLRRSIVALKLAISYLTQAVKCLRHSNTTSIKERTLCTRYSTRNANIYGCTSSIHFFQRNYCQPYHIQLTTTDDMSIEMEIKQIKHCLKNQAVDPRKRQTQIKTMKWLEELQYYRNKEGK